MFPFGGKHHAKKHDMGDSKHHKGNIYDSLVGAVHTLTASNVAVDTQTLNDAISAAIHGMDWQEGITNFHAMVTSEPPAPSDGDRYISTEAGVIPSTRQTVAIDDVCEWSTADSEWKIYTPEDGWAVLEEGVDPNIAWWYSGVQWRKLGTIIDHPNLLNLNWSVAGHVIDADIDMNDKKLVDCRHFDVYYASGAHGNNTTGDGSINNPYASIQKVVDNHLIQGGHVIIHTDLTTSQIVTLPDYVADTYVEVIGDFSKENFDCLGQVNITVGDFCVVTVRGVKCSFADSVGLVSGAIVILEGGKIESLDAASTIDFLLYLTEMSATAETRLAAASSVAGLGVREDGDLVTWGNGTNALDAKGLLIKNVGNPVAGTDGDNKDSRDGAISTHAGLTASVHNFDASGNAPAQSHGNEKHSTAFIPATEKGAASGVATLTASSKHTSSEIPFGAVAGTVCEGNDSRLSDSRVPTIIQGSEEAEDTTIEVTFQQSYRFSPTLEIAKYIVMASLELTIACGDDAIAKVEIDDTTEILTTRATPINVDNLYDVHSCVYLFNCGSAGVHNFDFDFMSQGGIKTAKIRRKRIVLMKVVE